MEQIHKDRLNRLIYDMEQMMFPPEQRAEDLGPVLRNGPLFNIRDVGRGSFDESGHACATVCCVAGTAAMDPEFNAQGLDCRFVDTRDKKFFLSILLDGEPVCYDDAVLANWFGLHASDWHDLVSPDTYCPSQLNDPLVVIQRIRNLISSYERMDAAVRRRMIRAGKPPVEQKDLVTA